MIVFVETAALERDPDLAEDLFNGGSARVGVALVGLGAIGQGVVRKRLPELEHFAGAFTSIVVGRHGSRGYPASALAAPL